MATTSSSPILLCTTKSRLTTWPIAWKIDNMSRRRTSVSSLIYNYPKNCFTTINYSRKYNVLENSFTMELEPNSEDNLSLTIRSTSISHPSVKLYIITDSGEKQCLYESPKAITWTYGDIIHSTYKTSFTIDKFISRDKLFDPIYGYLPEDQLTIIVEFTFLVIDCIDYNVQGTFGEPLEQMKLTGNSKTREAYAQLLTTGKLSDITLIVDGKAIPAHKAILAIRSPVLAAMFEGDTKEAQESRVQITDVKVDVFEQMLAFIYTGTMPSLNQSTAEELLVTADKYQVDDLKAICENYLCSQLSAASAPNLVLFAEAINAPKLKECALKFINSRAIDVFKTMASESDQLVEMIRILALKNQEKDMAADGK